MLTKINGWAGMGAAVAMAVAWPAAAATIENPYANSRLALSFFEVGQSFTALDEQLVSVGFWMGTMNVGSPNDPFVIDLYEGDGFGGTLLATRSGNAPLDLPADVGGGAFLGLDFGGFGLMVGDIYTVKIRSASMRLGVSLNRSGGYDFGRAYIGGRTDLLSGDAAACLTGGCDATFRIEGYTNDTGVVPEPATWAMMLTGFGLGGAALRRRRSLGLEGRPAQSARV